MITNPRVLRSEFVPGDVVHRDAEIDTMTTALEPVTQGDPGETTFVYGPSGAGKTCIAENVLERLCEAVIGINTHTINCWEDSTRFKVLYGLLDGIGQATDIHRQSTPTDTLVDRLQDYNGPPYVVILDDVDQLSDMDVLYDLARMGDITLVLIATREEEFYAQLESRIASRLQSARRVEFDVYTTDELVAILDDRVEWGLEPGVITTNQLELIADAAAGDARVAIEILRGAARQAGHDDADTISDAHIHDTVPHAKTEIKRKQIEKLNDDQRLVYDIITDHGEITPGTLYEIYQQQAEDPRTNRMVRYYLEKLSHYNLIESVGENRGRIYRPIS